MIYIAPVLEESGRVDEKSLCLRSVRDLGTHGTAVSNYPSV